MKKFCCGDVVPGCDTRFLEKSQDDVVAAVAVHARDAHDMAEVPDHVVDAVRSLIVTVD